MALDTLDAVLEESLDRTLVADDAATTVAQLADRLRRYRGRTWRDLLVARDFTAEGSCLVIVFRLVNRRGRLRQEPLREALISDAIVSMARSTLMDDLMDTGASLCIDIEDPTFGIRQVFRNVLGQLMRIKGNA